MRVVSTKALMLGAMSAGFIGLIAGVVFLSAPGIDLWVASQFGSEVEKFPLRFHPVPRFFNDLVNILAGLLALTCLLGLALTARFKAPILGLWARHYGYLLATLITGPGLIANGIFKENWGRARPRHLAEFGGEASFSPPLLISDQCVSNCSFVSGDASLAFFFVAIALVLPAARRVSGIVLALAFGGFIGFMRIIQGAHFLSDVLFAGVFVSLTALGLYWLMLRNWQAPQGAKASLAKLAGLRNKESIVAPDGKGAVWMFFRAKPGDIKR